MACRPVAGLAFRGMSCPLPMMAFPLLVVHARGGLSLMPDPTAVAELELPVVDASSGGQGPSPAVDMEGEKEESEPERERRHKTKGSGEEATAQPFVLSDGLAPVPAKLVGRILRGDFVDMAELFRDNLEAQRRGVIQESSAISSDLKRDRREVPDLLSWVQCFGTYMAVVTSAQPTKSKELLAYQTLIVREARRCGGRGWLAYDTMFRQQAAGNPEVDWSKLNPTLYAVTFLAQSGSGRNCVLCMESDHNEEDCALAKGKVGPLILKTSSSQRSGVEGASRLPKGKSRMVCFSWNQGECSFPYCRYRHNCIKCGGEHRIIQCNAWGADRESWRKQGREPQSRDPQGRDPQGRQLAH